MQPLLEPPTLPATTLGPCPSCGECHRALPSHLAQDAALSLIRQIKQHRRLDFESPVASPALALDHLEKPEHGKMFGVLVCRDSNKMVVRLKAFSGQLAGEWDIPNWVPSLPNISQDARASTASDYQTLEELNQSIEGLNRSQGPQLEVLKSQRAELQRRHHAELAAKKAEHQVRRSERTQKRRLAAASGKSAHPVLDDQSRRDNGVLRALKQTHQKQLDAVDANIDMFSSHTEKLRNERRVLSRRLTNDWHNRYTLTNFRGQTWRLPKILEDLGSIPTGTGDCCAPKLLHHAATHNLRPVALIEFWLGAPNRSGTRRESAWYSPCQTKCVPLLPFLLCGLD